MVPAVPRARPVVSVSAETPKSATFTRPSRVTSTLRGLEIEVQDAVVVRERERGRHAGDDRRGLVERERLAGVVEDVRERRAVEVPP